MDKEARIALAAIIEMLIDLMDQLDGDPNLEDDGCGEVEAELDIVEVISDYDRVPEKRVA